MLDIVIDNRNGYLWDLSGIVSSVVYKTTRIGKASSVDISFLKGGLYEAEEFQYKVGDVVRVRFKDMNVFLGYIFVIQDGRDEEVKITAYDQMRYLTVNEYYQGTNTSATDIVKHFAERLQLKTADLIDTAYKIPKIREDGIKAIDIICGALESTLTATGKRYVFYDDFGLLTLRNAEDMVVDLSLGDLSLLFDYKLKTSIDDAYNMVWLYQDNEKTGKREVYAEQDSANIAKWGLLKLVKSVGQNMNPAQIEQVLKNLMELKNRVGRTFQTDSLGDIRVRAGNTLSVNIEEVGIHQRFMIHECTHKFEGNEHTMTLHLIDVRIGDKKVTVVT